MLMPVVPCASREPHPTGSQALLARGDGLATRQEAGPRSNELVEGAALFLPGSPDIRNLAQAAARS